VATSTHTFQDPAECALWKRLCQIREGGKIPLISIDMDDTFLPFGAVITERELEITAGYLQAGGHIAFNTLAPKEWFYRRVLEGIVNAFHRNRQCYLLSRIHWIVSGGIEIFVCDNDRSYRRVHFATQGSKAEGLLQLMSHLDPALEILALYGDCFGDPVNDGSAIGNEQIPLVINVGPDQPGPSPSSGAKQIFLNTIEKGPPVTLRHLAFLTEQLTILSPQLVSQDSVATTQEFPMRNEPLRIEVDGAGFVWSWDKQGCSHLTWLTQAPEQLIYVADLPEAAIGFTFFWTGGEDTKNGQSPGHWEGRDFEA
jgi:hypothetical protein